MNNIRYIGVLLVYSNILIISCSKSTFKQHLNDYEIINGPLFEFLKTKNVTLIVLEKKLTLDTIRSGIIHYEDVRISMTPSNTSDEIWSRNVFRRDYTILNLDSAQQLMKRSNPNEFCILTLSELFYSKNSDYAAMLIRINCNTQNVFEQYVFFKMSNNIWQYFGDRVRSIN